MGRILGIDFGQKRTGIAVTDPLQIIVTSLSTQPTENLLPYLSTYLKEEVVDKVVFGKPTHADGTPTYLNKNLESFITQFAKTFPNIAIDYQDESFSSIEAKSIIMASGIKKKKRKDKALVDRISAVIILQRYLKHIV